MNQSTKEPDFSEAVTYHYGAFPPAELDLSALIEPLTTTSATLARYDQMLRSMLNSEILLGPLRRRDAVISSRMEGTISTLDEVLQLEADEASGNADATQNARSETVEVFLYARAIKQAQDGLENGQPFSEFLIRSSHQTLLSYGRGAKNNPGKYKTEQNYIGQRGHRKIDFIPISPEQLGGGIERLFTFINSNDTIPLLRTALAHIEFEALHPFADGNGRVGRMLITLMLWQSGLISQPHFFVSGYFENHKEEYIARIRAVSEYGAWTEWCEFFLAALNAQALENIETANQIQNLYIEMKEVFRIETNSRWSQNALDYIFEHPIFRHNSFTRSAGIPPQTARSISHRLSEAGLLTTLIPPSGRRPAMFSFEPLLKIVRGED